MSYNRDTDEVFDKPLSVYGLKCSTKNQEEALEAVIGERLFQDRKWGTIQERPREVGTYLTLMRKILGDAEKAYCESIGDTSALHELRKVLAVGLACLEQYGAPSRRAINDSGDIGKAEHVLQSSPETKSDDHTSKVAQDQRVTAPPK